MSLSGTMALEGAEGHWLSTVPHWPQPPKPAALCLCPLAFSIGCTWNDRKSTTKSQDKAEFQRHKWKEMLRFSGDLPQVCLKDFGVDQIKWHHQVKKLSFHTGFPSNSTGWRSEGPLCFMEHKALWIRALSREGCKFCKHWKAYVWSVHTQKNKKTPLATGETLVLD